MKRRSIINLTDAAAQQVRNLIDQRNKSSTLGIRVSVKSGGCSGLSYTFEYVDQINKEDEVIEEGGIKIFIDNKAVMYIVGTTLDYVDKKIQSGFVFLNPNAKGQCGCGESFHV